MATTAFYGIENYQLATRSSQLLSESDGSLTGRTIRVALSPVLQCSPPLGLGTSRKTNQGAAFKIRTYPKYSARCLAKELLCSAQASGQSRELRIPQYVLMANGILASWSEKPWVG